MRKDRWNDETVTGWRQIPDILPKAAVSGAARAGLELRGHFRVALLTMASMKSGGSGALTIARTYLFVPGNRPERFAKAFAAGADAIILDLEDAVPPALKHAARESVAEWLLQAPRAAVPTLLRINAVGTDWFRDDLQLCGLPSVAGVLLAKAERVEDLATVQAKLPAGAHLLPLVETAQGFSQALNLAQSAAVQRLVFGALDFQLDMGIPGEGEALLYFRSQLVLISRLAGLQPPVDGINANFNDAERLRADTLYARGLGFGGKLLIHPRQVAVVRECYLPSAEEVDWAHRVLQAAGASLGAAVAMNGELVDRPIIAKAEAILNQAAQRS